MRRWSTPATCFGTVPPGFANELHHVIVFFCNQDFVGVLIVTYFAVGGLQPHDFLPHTFVLFRTFTSSHSLLPPPFTHSSFWLMHTLFASFYSRSLHQRKCIWWIRMTHPNVTGRLRLLAQWCCTHPLRIAPQLHMSIAEFVRWTPLTNDTIRALLCKPLDIDDVQYGPIDEWDTSQVTSMERLFYCANPSHVGINIEHWDTSSVTSMKTMFFGYPLFNCDISRWNTSSVVDMGAMFVHCDHFNVDISRWNTSAVIDMSNMFANCERFNQPIGQWDVSNVRRMCQIFFMCSSFNQPLQEWNVSNVRNMEGIFRACSVFNQPLQGWNVSNVLSTRHMFFDCNKFNQPLDMWDVSNVRNMEGMFCACSRFNQPLQGWNVSNTRTMAHMFSECRQFNQPLDMWDVRQGCLTREMFARCHHFRQSLTRWGIDDSTVQRWREESGGALYVHYFWFM